MEDDLLARLRAQDAEHPWTGGPTGAEVTASLDPETHVARFAEVDHRCLFVECPGYVPRSEREPRAVGRAVDWQPSEQLREILDPGKGRSA